MARIKFTTTELFIEKDNNDEIVYIVADNVDINDFIEEFEPSDVFDAMEYSDVFDYLNNPVDIETGLGALELYTKDFEVKFVNGQWNVEVDNVTPSDFVSGYFSGAILSSLSDHIDDYVLENEMMEN